AGVEGDHLVLDGIAAGQHHNWHGRPGPDAADEGQPVDARQAQVDQRNVHGALAEHLEGRLTAVCGPDAAALGLEDTREVTPDGRLVLDDQDGAEVHGRARRVWGRRVGAGIFMASLRLLPIFLSATYVPLTTLSESEKLGSVRRSAWRSLL